MRKIRKFYLNMLIGTVFLSVFLRSSADDNFRPFMADQYSPEKFKVFQAEFFNGNTVIRIIQAKKTIFEPGKSPALCRAWLMITKEEQDVFKRFFNDIDAVGSYFGLFIPEVQPPPPYFAIVKHGDYDGRLYLVHKNGDVYDLIGGAYFITDNNRYIFSEYSSDASGLAVFDLQEGRVVFSSDQLMEHQFQWYLSKDGSYFFTPSEWVEGSVWPNEKKGVAFYYEFETHKIVEKSITTQEIEKSKKVSYDFTPANYSECEVSQ